MKIFFFDDFKYELEEDKNDIKEEAGDIVYEGYLKQKVINSWENNYFKLKNGFLYCFTDKNSTQFQSKISINDIIKIDTKKDNKFILVVNSNLVEKYDFKGKIYKFYCNTNEEKDKWIDLIKEEMKKLGNKEKDKNIKLDIPIRKKLIIDIEKMPEINKDINIIRKKKF